MTWYLNYTHWHSAWMHTHGRNLYVRQLGTYSTETLFTLEIMLPHVVYFKSFVLWFLKRCLIKLCQVNLIALDKSACKMILKYILWKWLRSCVFKWVRFGKCALRKKRKPGAQSFTAKTLSFTLQYYLTLLISFHKVPAFSFFLHWLPVALLSGSLAQQPLSSKCNHNSHISSWLPPSSCPLSPWISRCGWRHLFIWRSCLR